MLRPAPFRFAGCSCALLGWLLISGWATAQTSPSDLTAFNRRRVELNRLGVIALGTWAVGNVGVSVLRAGQVGGQDRYFHRMNLYWNVVNLTLAGFGYYQALREDPGALGAFASLKAQYSTEKILLFNAGLDVGYVLGGLYLTERANRFGAGKQHDQLRGFGRSVVLQGGFLLVFDVASYLVHHHHLGQSKSLFDNLTFSGSSAGILLRF
ncbi:MAG: hypothetical protein H7Z75_11455 [Ferruginibacter sp.]|nr:hypothetical protein [Cytophagales bacterium]